MPTAVDTNVIIALWNKDATLSLAAQNASDAAFNRGAIVAAAPVFAKLIATPGRSEKFVGSFLGETGIGVDWGLSEQTWRLAGRAFQAYAERPGSSAIGAPAVSLRTSSLARMRLQTDSAFSPSTRAYIGQPF